MSISEKNSAKEERIHAAHDGSSSDGGERAGVGSSSGLDTAWKFLDAHRDAGDPTEGIDMKALRRKIDWRIVPLMFLAYTLQFLDKVILNVSQQTVHNVSPLLSDVLTRGKQQ
jgi:hypothetical protein